jgi:HlyD family secretion protein
VLVCTAPGFVVAEAPMVPSDGASSRAVGALGRIEPRRGVRRIAGPPRAAAVIESLMVEEGDRVARGDVLALLQGIALLSADVDRAQAELAQAERELARREGLRRGGAAPDTQLEAARLARDVARAVLARANAERELSRVRAPLDGQVLEIHAREGERVGADGIMEIGDTLAMFVVAEVYETEIAYIRVGQRASARSPALPQVLSGVVDRIGLKIGKKDVLTTDPVADADARVVEVEVRLDDPAPAATLTNLRVDVVFEP